MAWLDLVWQHIGVFSDTNELTLGEFFMNLTTTLKVSLAAACVIAFAGCTDLKPIQAQIDDLKSQVSKLQGDTARASSDAAAAKAAAASAQSAASGAQSTANQALSTAQANSTAIEAINEKIDRMFKKSVSK
jgi:murein lipoprotein